MNYPVYPGSQYPDAVKPLTYGAIPEAKLPQILNSQPIVNDNPFDRVPTTSPFAQQYLQQNSFEPIKRIVENVTENMDAGWEFVAARPRVMAYNQTTDIIRFPRRPMPRVPSDVPAPVITHERERFTAQMDEYKLQFEMEGKFLVFGGEEATLIQTNYVYSLLSSMITSWRYKIKYTFMNVRQNQWQQHYKVDNPKSLREVNKYELQNYARLDLDPKGFPNMLLYVKQLTRMQQFDFNMCVLPFGKLDAIASNSYFTEAFRVGNSAIETVFGGGKRLKAMVDNMQVFEDSKESFKVTRTIEEQAFVQRVTRGGYIYNGGHVDCDDEDDPNCKYGFQYIQKGNKNWATKTLLDLIRESGRYGPDGKLDPFIWTLCRDWEDFSAAMGVYVREGRLDPMAYRISSEYTGNDSVVTTFTPTIRFGEQDPAYSPLGVLRRHIRRVSHLLKHKMTSEELKMIAKLENYRKTFRDISSVGEAQEAFLGAVVIANTLDTPVYNNGTHTFQTDFDHLSMFLDRDPFNMAPKQLPQIRDVPNTIEPNFVGGAKKALSIVRDSKVHFIFSIKYDTKAASPAYNRGKQGNIFAYVAIPEDEAFIQKANWDTVRAASNVTTHFFDQVIGNFVGAGNANAVGVIPDVWRADGVSPVSPELYESNNAPVAAGQWQWAFRPTADVAEAIKNATAGRLSAASRAYYGGTPPAQGFTLSLSPVPAQPYFCCRISSLRYLASLNVQSDKYGWKEEMISDIADGVKGLDKLYGILLSIYTSKNLYFNPIYVPFDIQTNDEDLDRLNTAISNLWCDQDKPFLARRPMRMKSAAGNWVFPRNFVSWSNSSDRVSTIQNTAKLLRARFGLAYNVGELATATRQFSNATDDGKMAYCRVVAFNTLMESGLLSGRVKDVLLSSDKWNDFTNSYGTGQASLTYAHYLQEYKKSVYPNAQTNALRDFTEFIRNEILPYLRLASQVIHDYFNTITSPANAANAANMALSSAEAASIAHNVYSMGYMLLSIITLWLDSSNMNYSIGYAWLQERKARANEPLSMISTTGGKDDLQIITDTVMKNIDSIRKGMSASSDTVAGTNTTQFWINTGLAVTPNLWKRFDDEIETISRSAAANPDRLVDLYYAYCLPMRPMKGMDQSKPIAGEPLWETQTLIAGHGNNTNVAHYVKGIMGELSQAMTHKGGMGLDRPAPDEPMFLQSGKLQSRRADVEQLASGISSSIYEQASKRPVPGEFMTTTLYDSNGREMRGGYLTSVKVQTASNLIIDVSQEPQFMKWRLKEINEIYKSDTIERSIGHLWCFSPFDFHVIENMIMKKVTPAGTGYMMLRPFQTDLMGSVLFTVADKNVAESGYNYVFSQGASNMQHDKVNVLMNCMLGCQIYQPDKVLWLKAQTMHGNVGGMGGDMYVNPSEFDISKIHSPTKDGFIIYVGDNLDREKIRDCISITSRYNSDRYTPLISNKAILESDEQHVPGLFYTIAKFELYKINSMKTGPALSFIQEKNSLNINTDCYSEDCRLWNKATGSFSDRVIGNWHLSRLSPDDAEFLEGSSAVKVRRVNYEGLQY